MSWRRRAAWLGSGLLFLGVSALLVVGALNRTEDTAYGIGRALGAVVGPLVLAAAVLALAGLARRRGPRAYLRSPVLLLLAAVIGFLTAAGRVLGEQEESRRATQSACARAAERFVPGPLEPGFRYQGLTRARRRELAPLLSQLSREGAKPFARSVFRGSTEVGFVVAARLPRVERVRRGFVAGARRAGARVRRTQLVGRPSDLVLPSRTTPAGYLSRTLSVVGCQAVFVFAADRDSVLRLGDGILRAEQVP